MMRPVFATTSPENGIPALTEFASADLDGVLFSAHSIKYIMKKHTAMFTEIHESDRDPFVDWTQVEINLQTVKDSLLLVCLLLVRRHSECMVGLFCTQKQRERKGIH
jgi:hypothetical protein